MKVTRKQLNSTRLYLFSQFMRGYEAEAAQISTLAEFVESNDICESYGMFDGIGELRLWIEDRQVQQLCDSDYSIKNNDYEKTISVDRNKVRAGRYAAKGLEAKLAGDAVRRHPIRMIHRLLTEGTTNKSYDGVPYFSASHPHAGTTFSNLDSAGSGDFWFLVDAGNVIKPFIAQRWGDMNMVAKVKNDDDNVFWEKKFIFGVDYSGGYGYTLPQLSYASNQAMTLANIKDAWTKMTSVNGVDGTKVGVLPTHLIVPPSLSLAAQEALKQTINGGEQNIMFGNLQLITSRHI